MTAIINKSLTTSHVPLDLKAALIRPVLKTFNLDSDCLGNYRPVSNLSFLSKILKRVVDALDFQTIETEILNICKDVDTYKASAVEFLSSENPAGCILCDTQYYCHTDESV